MCNFNEGYFLWFTVLLLGECSVLYTNNCIKVFVRHCKLTLWLYFNNSVQQKSVINICLCDLVSLGVKCTIISFLKQIYLWLSSILVCYLSQCSMPLQSVLVLGNVSLVLLWGYMSFNSYNAGNEEIWDLLLSLP